MAGRQQTHGPARRRSALILGGLVAVVLIGDGLVLTSADVGSNAANAARSAPSVSTAAPSTPAQSMPAQSMPVPALSLAPVPAVAALLPQADPTAADFSPIVISHGSQPTPAPPAAAPVAVAAAPVVAAPAAGTNTAAAAAALSGPNQLVFDPSTSWAVLVGISTYDRPTHPTFGGDGDVAVFHQLLNQAGWPDSHILILTDQAASANAIRSAMHWLISHSGAGLSVFHYSGHVNQASGHTYLWGVDNQFISEDEFGSTMRSVAGHAWIDIAGCESAAFDTGVSSPLRFFTASSGGHEKSYEEPAWGESVWTGLTVDRGMLRHNAGAGPISVERAVRWSQNAAAGYTQGQQPYGAQHPYAVGGDAEWYLGPAVAPAPTSGGVAPVGSSAGGGGGSNSPPGSTAPPVCTNLGLIKFNC